ncbi:MAG: CDP-alcohol phosphatidyltransferase family protein [Archaeoglobaceae archaeon]
MFSRLLQARTSGSLRYDAPVCYPRLQKDSRANSGENEQKANLSKFCNDFSFYSWSLSVIPLFYNSFLSVVLISISQILDRVDGDLARISGEVSAKGAYLDRLFDRFVDFALILAISAYSKL